MLHFILKIISIVVFVNGYDPYNKKLLSTYFPSFDGERSRVKGSEITFFFNYYVEESNDIFLIKCPGKNLIIMNDNYIYIPNEENSSILGHTSNDSYFTWYLHKKPESNSIKNIFKCGTFKSDGPLKKGEFVIEIKKSQNVGKNLLIKNIYLDNISSMKCKNSKALIQSHIDNIGRVRLGMPASHNIFKNQIFYTFNLKDATNEKEVVYPCTVIKPYTDFPEIKVRNCEESLNHHKYGKLCIIKKMFTKQLFNAEAVHTDTRLINFYSQEKLFYSLVKYTRTNDFEVLGEENLLSNDIIVDNYVIFKIRYFCDICGKGGNPKTISKIIYFGSYDKNKLIYSEAHTYATNTLKIKPNCSLNKYNFAYLKKIVFKNRTTMVDKIRKASKRGLNGFILRNGYIKYVKDRNPDGTLECHFKTPTMYVLEKYIFRPIRDGTIISINSDGTSFLQKKKIPKYVNVKKSQLNENIKKQNDYVDEEGNFLQFIYKIRKYVIAVFLILSLNLIFIIVIFMVTLKRKIYLFLSNIRSKQRNVNIGAWWEFLSNQDLLSYINLIHSNLYVPEKVLNQQGKTFIYEGEDVECNFDSLYESTLVDSQKNIEPKISAHYIETELINKKYILSDHPSPQLIPNFWSMLFNENVSVVVSFFYKYPENEFTKAWMYWPQSNESYGGLTVKRIEDKDIKLENVSIYTYSVTDNQMLTKSITIFHVERWKEHTPPQSTSTLIDLYKCVKRHSEGKKVLVTSRNGAGSTMFTFIYFACIVEHFVLDQKFYNPFNVIKNVRECRYGGFIGTLEFCYIITAVVDYFYTLGIIENNTAYSLFSVRASTFIMDVASLVADVSSEMKAFFYFSVILDQGIVKQMCTELKIAGKLDENTLKNLCSIWYNIEGDLRTKDRNRYNNIPCFDKNALSTPDEILKSRDIGGYINANEMIYEVTNEFERCLIMCQAPTKSTAPDVVEMMFKKNVGTLVLLADEGSYSDTWVECFPYNCDQCVFGNYTVVKLKDYSVPQAGTYILDFYIVKDKDKVECKLLHYRNWPARGNPLHAWEFLSLYRLIMDSAKKRPIVIQCPNGVGWTGSLALIIYMIDNIGKNYYFDPIKDLAYLRQFRNGAVQTEEQLMMAFIVLREHYRHIITANKFKIYKWYKLFYKKFFFNPNPDPQLLWNPFMIESAAKAGFNYLFEDEA